MRYLVESKYCCKINGVKVYIDSSSTELEALLTKQRGKSMRGLASKTEMFYWPSRDAIHTEFEQSLINDGMLQPGETTIPIKILLEKDNIIVFTYAAFIKEALANENILAIIKAKPGNELVEM